MMVACITWVALVLVWRAAQTGGFTMVRQMNESPRHMTPCTVMLRDRRMPAMPVKSLSKRVGALN